MKQKLLKDFQCALQELVNKRIFEISMSYATVLLIKIGEKTISKPPDYYHDEIMIYGEYSISISCDWNICVNDELYCYDYDIDKYDYKLLEEKIQILNNKKIIKVILYEDSYEVTIEFEDNIILNLYVYNEDSEGGENTLSESYLNEFEYDKYIYFRMHDRFHVSYKNIIVYEKEEEEVIYLKDYKGTFKQLDGDQ